MALKLHAHPLSSYCWKTLIGLYEAELPFEFEMVNLGDPDAAAAFRALSPFGRMPALEDPDQGLLISESTIILEHIARRYPSAAFLIPADPAAAEKVRLWDRYFDLYLHNPMQKIVGDRLRPADVRDPHGVSEARAAMRAAYGVFSERVADRSWACGEFSMADCAAAPSLYYAQKVEPFRGDYPALAAYLDRLMQRPSFARVLAEAEPFLHFFPADPDAPPA